MSDEATRTLILTVLPAAVVANCTQCDKRALMRVETEQSGSYACGLHVQLAVNHYLKAHGVR